MAKSSKGRKKAAAKKPAPARRRAAGAKTPKKKAAKKAPARAAARRAPAKKAAKKAPRKAVKAVAKKAAARKAAPRKAAPKKSPARAVAKKAVAKSVTPRKMASASKPASARTAPAPAPKAARPAPGLNRERRTVRETPPPSAPSTLGAHQHASAAASGADELRVKLASHTGDGPALTAGDVDANWQAADAVGDESPGGDNPTPDQDVVDEIGRALGVEYDDDEELQGGDEIAARDHDRWELDPASSDDFDER